MVTTRKGDGAVKRWGKANRLVSGALLAVLAISLALWAIVPGRGAAPVDSVPEEEDTLLILMYHGILPDDSRGLGDYVIAVSEFESDLRYLTQNGYHSVGIQDVIDHVKNGTHLPQKAVMITFDDGYYNNYLYAYPLLQTYSFQMVLSPICKWSDFYSEQQTADARYTHVTWDELREMTASGLVEVANHSYDMHTQNQGRKGTAKKQGESVAAYQQLLSADLQRAQERFQEELGQAPTAFAYPFGAVSGEAMEVLQSLGFEAAFTCEEKINVLTDDPACLYRLGRYKRPHGVSSAAFFQKILS